VETGRKEASGGQKVAPSVKQPSRAVLENHRDAFPDITPATSQRYRGSKTIYSEM
jgi:hypothetical protein